ncbi:MAG: tol-pal system-associated acyl-CoA thioesterase [Alphaproteobacteria bacterium]|jgi:acyl-CoA thioester hydrolase|nr:tol-pal system-associated acyl-CoA thioesterase [Alphaproteobacteria bacterium]MDP7222622.1 tol-pal system-associated acyl-CoA thioesterase [Alphaproteobacteria bacterium]
MTSHDMNIRIYYEDTDAGGVVYHANHLRFAERGRTEFLRHVGFENRKLRDEHDIFFVVRDLQASYRKPAFLDDMLRMETKVKALKKTRFVMKQSLFRHEELIFEMDVTVVCVQQDSDGVTKAVPMPNDVLDEFEKLVTKE